MIVVSSYPKSGLHLARALLRGSGVETTHTHNGPNSQDTRARAPDLHVIRDVRDVIVSAVCHFVLERPELDPVLIRPHVLAMADALRRPWKHAPGSSSWSHYVTEMTVRSRLTVSYDALVRDPIEALAPLVVIAPEAQALAASDYERAGVREREESWARRAFRRGAPGGWRDVLTDEQNAQILEWHRPGMLLVESLRAVLA